MRKSVESSVEIEHLWLLLCTEVKTLEVGASQMAKLPSPRPMISCPAFDHLAQIGSNCFVLRPFWTPTQSFIGSGDPALGGGRGG